MGQGGWQYGGSVGSTVPVALLSLEFESPLALCVWSLPVVPCWWVSFQSPETCS